MKLLGNDLRLSGKRRRAAYDEVLEVSSPELTYFVLTAVSIIIACYGLMLDNIAVIIGAMLVAPLMGPVFGIALGLTLGDRRMLWRAVKAEVLGVLLGIGVAALIGLMPLRLGFGAEIMARTQPTLYDLIVALVAGLAGAYALLDERVSPALPGVAISVSVVPPLAASGLLLAAGDWSLAAAAFLLFFANLLAIHIAAALVFAAFGMLHIEPDADGPPDDVETVGHWFRRFGLSLLALGLVAWFMTRTLTGLVHDYHFRSEVEQLLSAEIRSAAGAQLDEVRYRQTEDGVSIVAEVLTPRSFEPAQVAELEDRLRSRLDADLHLIVRSVLSRDIDRAGPVFATEEPTVEEDEEEAMLGRVWTALSQALETVPGSELADLHRAGPGDEGWVALVHAPEPIAPDTVAELQGRVNQKLSTAIELTVRSIPTTTATAAGYRYNGIVPPQ